MTNRNLTCAEIDERLGDHLEGALDDASVADLELHLSGCPACTALVHDFERITREAATLPALTPSHDLWPAIAQRLDAPVADLAAHAAARAAASGARRAGTASDSAPSPPAWWGSPPSRRTSSRAAPRPPRSPRTPPIDSASVDGRPRRHAGRGSLRLRPARRPSVLALHAVGRQRHPGEPRRAPPGPRHLQRRDLLAPRRPVRSGARNSIRAPSPSSNRPSRPSTRRSPKPGARSKSTPPHVFFPRSSTRHWRRSSACSAPRPSSRPAPDLHAHATLFPSCSPSRWPLALPASRARPIDRALHRAHGREHCGGRRAHGGPRREARDADGRAHRARVRAQAQVGSHLELG